MKYDFAAIEKKWQEKWEQEKPYAAVTGDKKPKFYGLIEFPYPSAAGLHVGHPRPFTAMDIICRKKRMQGYNVLNPIGFDACARGTFLNEIAENLTNMCFDYLDAPPVVIGARNWITPPHEFDKYFFPYAEWIIDAVNARLIPLEGYTSTTTPDEAEIIRRNKLGV